MSMYVDQEPVSEVGFFHGAPPAAQADEGRPLTAGQAPALAVGEQAGKAGRPDAGVAGEPEPSPVSGADEDALATEGDESAEAGPAEALARRGQEPRRQPDRPGADKPEWLTQIELGQRWQSVQGGSEGGKMLPPDPAAAASREPRARSPVAPGREEPAPLVKAAVSLAGDAANAASPVPAAAAAADAGAGTPASPTERLVAAERSLHLGASPEQGARQLSQQIQLMVNQNLQEADIRLSPSELGGLRIQLKMEQGEVNIQFTATQPQARELLEQALPRLREMLGQQGLAMGQGQVGGSAQQQGQQQGMAQQQEANPLPAGTGLPAAEEDGDWGTLESSRLATLAPGRIDFFA
ncbi:flagellar hook-length control protein FliK [Zobellella denitrificans]